MKRVLSGIQSSGTPHLGNYLGAMKRHVERQDEYESFIFIADLHSLTTVRDAEKMQKMVEFYLYYIQHWSLLLDLKIIFMTIFKGFVNKNAY